MKRSWLMPIVSFFLIAFVTAYMGYHIITALSDSIRTVEAVVFAIEDSIPVNGWFVRDEALIPRTDGIVMPTVENGERLAKGDAAFYIYQNLSAIQLTDDLSELNRRIEDMEYVSEHSAANMDVSQLDRLIFARVTDMLDARDTGDRKTVLEQGLEFKSLVFRREHTYGHGADMSAALEALKARQARLTAESESAVSDVKAVHSGVFTTEVDGYEETFSMESLDTVTLAEFQNPRRDARLIQSSMGKQTLGFSWGYIITISEEEARFLKVGQALSLRFTDVSRTVVDFKIKRIHIEDGQAVISLTTSSNMSTFINIRRLPADVVMNAYSGLRVPKEAIRLDADGVTGVYCLMGSRAVFKPVDIISERDNYYLIEFDPVTAKASQLLPSDRMIIDEKGIYDGKVYTSN